MAQPHLQDGDSTQRPATLHTKSNLVDLVLQDLRCTSNTSGRAPRASAVLAHMDATEQHSGTEHRTRAA
ncbi:hypothetical protein MAPG_01167 [Magnaporthiopsis poae ATCC 64411]|uniref:Uncharacterized protein n=1 Tax=Magnaporthiopsis poae (strain ATCC 64411 / 73-15) TaxID=644358 RepID=A0A0C4DMZ7_MAGP6|nr:hypothetical protein MAPG_01167 [Magnaporthiopsis poae ATCC 64411]